MSGAAEPREAHVQAGDPRGSRVGVILEPGPGSHRSPRHWMCLKYRHEAGFKCVSMMLRERHFCVNKEAPGALPLVSTQSYLPSPPYLELADPGRVRGQKGRRADMSRKFLFRRARGCQSVPCLGPGADNACHLIRCRLTKPTSFDAV